MPPANRPHGAQTGEFSNGTFGEITLGTHTVLADGYEWEGRPYRSLSAVARAITGSRRNGPAFFGLRERDAA